MNGSADYHQPVLEALCAFVRDGTIGMIISNGEPATDIQAVLTVISRRKDGPGLCGPNRCENPESGSVVCSPEGRLPGLHRSDRRDPTGANLTDAYLSSANLTGARLTGADLTGVHLYRVNLTNAGLFGANLTGADLRGANLTNADLTHANMTDAQITQAQLDQACGDRNKPPAGLTFTSRSCPPRP